LDGALRSGVEHAHRVDFIAEKVDAQRFSHVVRIDIYDAASVAKGARFLDDHGGLIASIDAVLEKGVKPDRVAHLKGAGGTPERHRRDALGHQRPDRGGYDRSLTTILGLVGAQIVEEREDADSRVDGIAVP